MLCHRRRQIRFLELLREARQLKNELEHQKYYFFAGSLYVFSIYKILTNILKQLTAAIVEFLDAVEQNL